jgi:hypothetical protein
MRYGLLLAILFFFCLAPSLAQETPAPPEPIDTIYGLISLPTVDVRAGPDFAYPTIGQLTLNTSVVILGRSGDFINRWDGRQWVQIQYGQTSAWVYARLVRTSVAFNSIFPTGRTLPRDANGRVPEEFDLTTEVCSQWQGEFTRSGEFMAGDAKLTVTYPLLTGANVYSVIVIAPDGQRTAFDSTNNVAEILLERLPFSAGTYTWRVAPYWTSSNFRFDWQQICLLRTGGTFDKPDTNPFKINN